jgi:hypothetical protein
MTEREFIIELVQELDLKLPHCRVATHKSILYDLTVDDDGVVRMGVDTETGEPLRGGGKGFEQDLLIYESPESDALPVVPRVIAEVKYNNVTTHDAIVYSEKARRIRAVYPYVRYGLILGGFTRIPGRVLRLGQGFDYVLALQPPLRRGKSLTLEGYLRKNCRHRVLSRRSHSESRRSLASDGRSSLDSKPPNNRMHLTATAGFARFRRQVMRSVMRHE